MILPKIQETALKINNSHVLDRQLGDLLLKLKHFVLLVTGRMLMNAKNVNVWLYVTCRWTARSLLDTKWSAFWWRGLSWRRIGLRISLTSVRRTYNSPLLLVKRKTYSFLYWVWVYYKAFEKWISPLYSFIPLMMILLEQLTSCTRHLAYPLGHR